MVVQNGVIHLAFPWIVKIGQTIVKISRFCDIQVAATTIWIFKNLKFQL